MRAEKANLREKHLLQDFRRATYVQSEKSLINTGRK